MSSSIAQNIEALCQEQGIAVLGMKSFADGYLFKSGAGVTPTQIAGGLSWAAVTVGYQHSCGVRTNATAACSTSAAPRELELPSP